MLARGLGIVRAADALDERVRQQLRALGAEMDRLAHDRGHVEAAQFERGLPHIRMPSAAIYRREARQNTQVAAKLARVSPVGAGR
jgi:hypothetical protein